MFFSGPNALSNRIMVSMSAAAMVAAVLVACTTTNLTPAPNAERAPGSDNAAIDNVRGVRATVESRAWAGDADVARKLTPMYVRIENTSDTPIRIRYNEFALIGPAGEYFSALPPLAAQTSTDDTASFAAERINQPTFEYNAFFIAPPYDYAYDVPVWSQDFHHDPFYHETYYDAYRDLGISAAELQAQALPEGVLASKGHVSGFLYFEHVDPELPRVHFRADLVDAQTGRTIGSLSIPFTVEGGD